jgi:hypothetical protein
MILPDSCRLLRITAVNEDLRVGGASPKSLSDQLLRLNYPQECTSFTSLGLW